MTNTYPAQDFVAGEQQRLQKQKLVLKKAYLREQALCVALEKQLSGRDSEIARLSEELRLLRGSSVDCNHSQDSNRAVVNGDYRLSSGKVRS